MNDREDSTRRRLIGGALAGLIPLALGGAGAAGDMPPLASDQDIDRALPALTNWGRWGAEDQLGTLNHITPATRLAAAALIRTGHAIPLAREIAPLATPNLRQVDHRMQSYLDPPPEESGSLDYLGMVWHGFGVSHMDALCHFYTPEGRQGMYNGFPVSEVTDQGARRLGIEHAGGFGIAGRGVLLDIARLKGAPLPPGGAITAADLDAAERAAGLAVGAGDILLVRNGAGPANTYRRGTGLTADCLPWLQTRRIAALGGDSDNDVHPPMPGLARWTEPIHMVGIPYMGLSLIDQLDLDALAAHCAAAARWEFFLTVAPWRIRGTTASPVNPLALF